MQFLTLLDRLETDFESNSFALTGLLRYVWRFFWTSICSRKSACCHVSQETKEGSQGNQGSKVNAKEDNLVTTRNRRAIVGIRRALTALTAAPARTITKERRKRKRSQARFYRSKGKKTRCSCSGGKNAMNMFSKWKKRDEHVLHVLDTRASPEHEAMQIFQKLRAQKKTIKRSGTLALILMQEMIRMHRRCAWHGPSTRTLHPESHS